LVLPPTRLALRHVCYMFLFQSTYEFMQKARRSFAEGGCFLPF
jgi:hypothetical protein